MCGHRLDFFSYQLRSLGLKAKMAHICCRFAIFNSEISKVFIKELVIKQYNSDIGKVFAYISYYILGH